MNLQVYSPWLRSWLPHLSSSARAKFDPLACATTPLANSKSVHTHPILMHLFEQAVPSQIEGFVLESSDRTMMEKCWPAGEEAAKEVYMDFCYASPQQY